MRVNLQIRQEKLESAIFRISKATGKSAREIVRDAARIFLLAAGKAMPPKGKWGFKSNQRKRPVSEMNLGYFFGKFLGDFDDIRGARKGTKRTLYDVLGFAGKKKTHRYFWLQKDANAAAPIKTRGLAKAPFWIALQRLGYSAPRGAFVAPVAGAIASGMTKVTRNKDDNNPFIRIQSDIDTAAGARPYAEITGFGRVTNQLSQYANKLERDLRKEWY